jgi:uncharacterized membrane protein YhaH (DUF805 family)
VVGDVEDAQEYQAVKIWSASGRVGRLRYLAYTTGASLLAVLVITAASSVFGAMAGSVLGMLVYIVTVVFCILVAIQRSHDMDWSGWTVLLQIFPVLGLIWIFKGGSAGSNSYGAPPPPNTMGVKILGLLLPVLFVIGVIAAIVIPAFANYTQRAAGG